jgi:hypothetical protein
VVVAALRMLLTGLVLAVVALEDFVQALRLQLHLELITQ